MLTRVRGMSFYSGSSCEIRSRCSGSRLDVWSARSASTNVALRNALDWFIDEIINPRITDAATAAVTSVLATRPNQFVEDSRASMRAHKAGIKFALASGIGQAVKYARNKLSRRRSFEFPCSIGLLDIIIPLFLLGLIIFGEKR